MLRNSYLEHYQRNSTKMSEFERDMLKHDDNHILNLQRPMSNNPIKKFSEKVLNSFTEDIMCNKDINNLLYSINARKELLHYLKQEKHILKITGPKSENDLNKEKYKKIYEIIEEHKKNNLEDNLSKDNLSLNRILINKKKEELAKIKNNINKAIYGQFQTLKKLKIKNKKFIRSQPKIEEKLTKLNYQPINEVRLKHFKKIFDNCVNFSKKNKNFQMPNIEKNFDNVYTRLYYDTLQKNSQYIFYKRKNKFRKNFLSYNNSALNENNSFMDMITKSKGNQSANNITRNNILNSTNKKEKNYYVINIFNKMIGKEFVKRVTPIMKKKCCKILSGGPYFSNRTGSVKNIRGNISRRRGFKSAKLTVDNCFLDSNYKDSDNSGSYEKKIINGLILTNTKPKHEIITIQKFIDLDYNTNLHLAVMKNSYKLVEYFINKDLNVNRRNKKGQTPLHLAVLNKNEKIIKLLLNNGADFYIKDKEGITPFDLASIEIKKNLQFE